MLKSKGKKNVLLRLFQIRYVIKYLAKIRGKKINT